MDKRFQIDTETVKGLLLINGGSAVALLAFLPSILDKPGYEHLAKSILWGLLVFHMGLIATLLHNHLRRRCSLAYDNGAPKRKILGLGTQEPCVCHISHLFMVIAYISFISGGLIIFSGGITSLSANNTGNVAHESASNKSPMRDASVSDNGKPDIVFGCQIC